MKQLQHDFEEWARWFRALSDPTRLRILHLLASERRPMTVGEIVAAVDVAQSTVSHHLKTLGEVRFVLVERRNTTSWWRVNDRCLDGFPAVTDALLGNLAAETHTVTS